MSKDHLHKLRVPYYNTPNQTKTNMFYLEVYEKGVFIGKRLMKMKPRKDPQLGIGCGADEINNTKIAIAEEFGISKYDAMEKTTMKFVDIFEDNNGFLFYYKWFDDIGNVKTPI